MCGPASTWSSCRSTTRGSATPVRSTWSTTPARGSRSTGGSTRGATSSCRTTTTRPRPTGGPSTPGDPVRSIDMVFEGGSITRRRRRHARHHHAVPAAPEPQPVDDAGRDRGGAARGARRRRRDLVAARSGARRRHRRPRRQHRRVRRARAVLVLQGCDDPDEADWLRLDVRPPGRARARSTPAGGRSRWSRCRCCPFAEIDRGEGRARRRAVPQLLPRQRLRRSSRPAAIRPTPTCWRSSPSSTRAARPSPSTSARSSPPAAAASTASPSRSPPDRHPAPPSPKLRWLGALSAKSSAVSGWAGVWEAGGHRVGACGSVVVVGADDQDARSDAAAACRGGHVKVNGKAAKPATPVKVGDRIEAYLHDRERILEVTTLIVKRVGAAGRGRLLRRPQSAAAGTRGPTCRASSGIGARADRRSAIDAQLDRLRGRG